MRPHLLCLSTAVICLLVAGCASTPATGVSTLTSTSTAPKGQATARVTLPTTPEPTLTLTPHSTANLPDVPLSQEGPWLVFSASTEKDGPRYLWVVNYDGTGLMRLIDEPVIAFDAQPVQSLENGVVIAYVTQSKPGAADLILRIITLPGREIETISLLMDATRASGLPADPYTVAASVQNRGQAWSPDGHSLAFVSALDGKSVDVYTYRVADRTVTHLASDPDQSYRLRWSPDGRYVIHEEFDYIAMQDPHSSALWAARADASRTVSLVPKDEYIDGVTYSWLSPAEMLITNHCYFDCDSDVRKVNIETGDIQYLLKEQLVDVAYAPKYDAWLLWRWTVTNKKRLILIRNGERIEIPGQDIYHVEWSESQNMFTAEGLSGERYTISLMGELSDVPMSAGWRTEYSIFNTLSPDNTLQAWNFLGYYDAPAEVWVGVPTGEPKVVFSGHDMIIHDVTWSPDSQRLVIFTTQGIFVARRPDFEPVPVTEGLHIDDWSGGLWEWLPQPAQGEE